MLSADKNLFLQPHDHHAETMGKAPRSGERVADAELLARVPLQVQIQPRSLSPMPVLPADRISRAGEAMVSPPRPLDLPQAAARPLRQSAGAAGRIRRGAARQAAKLNA